MNENELSKIIIGCAMKVHSKLGPGLLESAYEACLAYELSNAGLRFERQKALPLTYGDVKLEVGYRIDLIVEGKVIVDTNAVAELAPIHGAQMLTYLRLTNVVHMRDGIRRVANNL